MPVFVESPTEAPRRKRRSGVVLAAGVSLATALFWAPLVRNVYLSAGMLSVAGVWRARPVPASRLPDQMAAWYAEYCPPGITSYWKSRKDWGCMLRLSRLRWAIAWYDDPR